METKVYGIEINGFSQTFQTLDEIRTYVHGLKAQGRVKRGDNAVIYPGTGIRRDTQETYMFRMNESRTVAVA